MLEKINYLTGLNYEERDVFSLEQQDVIAIIDMLFEKRVKELGIILDETSRERIKAKFSNIQLVFNLNQIKTFESEVPLSKFGQKLVAKLLTGGFVAEYRQPDSSKHFQVFINTYHPLSDNKRKILHELTHVVDSVLASEFPDYYKDEDQESNDLKFFLRAGLAGLTAIIVCNWAVYQTDIVPANLQELIAMALSITIAYTFDKFTPYRNRPDEIRARNNEKMISGKISRIFKKVMNGK